MFSVLIPIYNHARFLRQAVFSALRSSLVTEVLLVDDGSRDESASVASALEAECGGRVRDLTVDGDGNRGAHQRLNELVAAARCEWVAVLNSDDVFVGGRFEKIAGDPGLAQADFVFGHALFMNESSVLVGRKRGPTDPGTPFPESLRVAQMVAEGNLLDLLAHQNYLSSTSNMVFRKSLHTKVGGFAAYRYVHDWDFALRAMILGAPLYIPRFLTAYRLHSTNTILEGQDGVDAEAVELFKRLLADFPELLNRPDFRRALENNANGACSTAYNTTLVNSVTSGPAAEGRDRPQRSH